MTIIYICDNMTDEKTTLYVKMKKEEKRKLDVAKAKSEYYEQKPFLLDIIKDSDNDE